MIPSVGFMEIVVILVVVAFVVLGASLILRLSRGGPSKPNPRK